MTIRNIQDYMNNLWDWTFLNDCFAGTRIKVGDGDGIVERNGSILLIETKSPGEVIPIGQAILFDAFVSKSDCFVLVIWGKPGKPTAIQFWKYQKKPIPADITRVKERVEGWFKWANSKKQPKAA